MTLNQIADKFSNMVNQAGNHELRERIKDSVKQAMATFIRHSIETHGIDDILKLSYAVNLIEVPRINFEYKFDGQVVNSNEKILRSENRIPYPVRFRNEAPFTYVGLPDFSLSFAKREYSEGKIPLKSMPSRPDRRYSYSLKNSYLYITGIDCETFKARIIAVESIWENPEEILVMYNNDMGQENVGIYIHSRIRLHGLALN